MVDGLDGGDGSLVGVGFDERLEGREGEAVGFADEDGGHHRIEDVFEEVGGEFWDWRKTPSVSCAATSPAGAGKARGGFDWLLCWLAVELHDRPFGSGVGGR